MSAPFFDHDDALLGALSELVSAQSSLNMYADPIPGAIGYVSQTDGNVKHAMEHLHAAYDLLIKAWNARVADRDKFHRAQLKLADRRPNEACAEYVAAGAELLALDRRGLSESDEAEALRDSMDAKWYRMSGADQAHARVLIHHLVERFETIAHDPGDEDR